MNKRFPIILMFVTSVLMTPPAHAMFKDDPWLTKVMFEFEYLQEDGEDVIEWDIDTWTGRDLSKFWIKSAGEYADSEFEDANIEFVYSRAVSAYWDQQFGVRHDFKPDPDGVTRNWLSYGFIGTAPYFVSVDARVFVGEESSSQLVIELEREMMITQEWVLTPELDIIANGQTNEQFNEGSGLAEIEFSLHLGYEHNGNRKFQPFVGLAASQTFGTTRRLAKADGSSSGDIEALIGIHSWF
ncbi:MAG: copper resistance protein B [Acidiferrobacterales bacterium]|nr:copper resistance protein B [Acidiferrobacterales bacterium]